MIWQQLSTQNWKKVRKDSEKGQIQGNGNEGTQESEIHVKITENGPEVVIEENVQEAENVKSEMTHGKENMKDATTQEKGITIDVMTPKKGVTIAAMTKVQAVITIAAAAVLKWPSSQSVRFTKAESQKCLTLVSSCRSKTQKQGNAKRALCTSARYATVAKDSKRHMMQDMRWTIKFT